MTIFSSRAQDTTSLINTLKVRGPILVSGLSSAPSFVVSKDGGMDVINGGGMIQMERYKASYISPAWSLVNLSNVLRLRIAARLENDSMLCTISPLYFRRSARIVSSVIIANSRKETSRSSWNLVMARARGSLELGWAEFPKDEK